MVPQVCREQRLGKAVCEWFMDDNPQPYGSWGNGAAMRIAPVGLLASTEAELLAIVLRHRADSIQSEAMAAVAIRRAKG
jgi:ADP-ribosylglycohydrolase